MSDYRIEHDLLGEMHVPAEALWGVHTARAMENFPISNRAISPILIHAYGAVKLACARTNHELGRWDEQTFSALSTACEEMIEGELDEHIVVDALQGGAGTSTNMNVNEVLANRALQILGKPLGDYDTLHPLEDVNLHQSTNDTYPTALKIAAVFALRDLQRDVIALLEAFQAKEKKFAHVVKVGRTQFQDAVLITLGREMSAYAEALSRDRWRIYKCEERLRVVNLGGMAVGTGLGAPRKFIFRAIEHLRQITSLGLARSENLVEATQNNDAFVEVSGIVKTLASNLLKISGDLRLLSSGPEAGFGELHLPARQAGSSIMPGKVNPVIPEAVSQAALRAIANDQALTQAVSMGSLELNAFLPLIADSLLETLSILANASRVFRTHCVEGLQADELRCRAHVHAATAAVTALVGKIGYEAAQNIAQQAARNSKPLRDVAVEMGIVTEEEFDELTRPERVMQLGETKTEET
jgi:aspartate ammonia-lyase